MVRSGESVININTGPDCIYYSFTVSLFPSGCCGLAMFEHYRSKWDRIRVYPPQCALFNVYFSDLRLG